jgi:SOS-response transcriptional repressor LexA
MSTMFPRPPLLSARQVQLVAALEQLTAAKGYAPSIRELADHMGLSFGRVGALCRTTAAKGAVVSTPGVARSLRVVRPAADTKPTATNPGGTTGHRGNSRR